MTMKHLSMPSRNEIKVATQNWMRDAASDQQDIDGYSLEELIDIASVSLDAYLKLLKLGEKGHGVKSEVLNNEIIKIIKKYENIKTKNLSRGY